MTPPRQDFVLADCFDGVDPPGLCPGKTEDFVLRRDFVLRYAVRVVSQRQTAGKLDINFSANNFLQYGVGQLKMEKIKKSENTKKY
jgi:hypothetical protein